MTTGGSDADRDMISGFYRTFIITTLALAFALANGILPANGPGGAGERIRETRRLMGVPWTVSVYAADQATGSRAIAAAFTEISRLERVLSDYQPASELSQLSARAAEPEPIVVSDDLWQVLVRAEEFCRRTDGAFDISVGPLTSLWRQSRRSGHLPRPDKLAAARAVVGPGALELHADSQAVRLPRAGSRLDPGGIGMGYAADCALDVLETHGIEAALIDASGDVVVSGPPPGARGWRIAVAPLELGGEAETLVLAHAAVTTSGDAYQAIEIDGTRYSHIVDPRTGLGVPGPAAVTVIAADATTADALATAASVLGPEAAPAVIAAYPDTSARFVWRTADGVRTSATGSWPGEINRGADRRQRSRSSSPPRSVRPR